MDSAHPPERVAEKGRVSAGLPGLTPLHRAVRDYRQQQAIKQEGMIATALERKKEVVAPDGDIPTTVLEAQLGRSMGCLDIITRLHRLNPNFIFERSLAAPTMGIYLPSAEGKRFVMAFELGYSPEFTFNAIGVDGRYKEKRGWRQIIARLVRQNLISLAMAEKVFNIPSGRSSARWQALTT